ncbi:T9SS type B sorting domain-containing protein [Mucilaginibacter terrigena]|uniref:T9SS type B sorting domain-containing protein n=1 Tax=Mucilaginibacter terrigena TaxID=2492395 RepID=A0A4Q5LJ17_9SPHI|nr:gliding motility-associated C-terminal domain-containing protein [Mucilaginibacter terrigena]RYU86865.1 T9SS type B sorting domain-containing protein [Mucilaginibacter terrigena]
MQFKFSLVTVLFLLCCYKLSAQGTAGSLGDPVVQEDFGSGDNPHYPNTSYPRVGGSCPNDGYYALAKTESGCHPDTWHSVLKDHTGNDGYMMIVNASASPGEFYNQQTPPLLCGGTTYEFSAYVKNLVVPAYAGSHEKPNLTFRIERLNGALIDSYDTGPIYETAGADDWQKVAKIFILPADVDAVVVKIINNAPGGTGNDLILDDIAFRAFGPVVQAGIADDAGQITTTAGNLCVGTSKTYTIKSQLDNNPDYKYQWQQNLNDGTGWADLPGEESTTLVLPFPASKPVGIYQYRLGVAAGANITSVACRVNSNTTTINVNAYPVPAAIPPKAFCEGETLILTAAGGASYRWTGPNLPETSQNPLVIPNVSAANAGRYHVEVISAGGCSTPQDVDVTINIKPVVAIDPVPPVCKGSATQLTATITNGGASAFTYNWLPAAGLSDAHAANPLAGPAVSTTYTLTVTNMATGCQGSAQVQVDVLDVPVADAGTDKKIFEGQSVKLGGNASADNVLSYSWSPPLYLDDPNTANPVANPPFDVHYLLTVTSANNCGIFTDEVFVRVFQKITIPSTFTPNNDGTNDLWNIEALETYPQAVISIFTRGGKQVFQSKGYSTPWNGKLNGKPLPAGTYYYTIDLKNDTPLRSGWVLLVR